MSAPFLSENSGRLIVELHVVPGSKKTQVSGLHDNRLKIKISSPPVEGKANAEIIEFFARLFDIPKRQVEIVRGELGRSKTIALTGITSQIFHSKIKVE